MELNLENSQFKLIDAPYPIGFVNNFIDEKIVRNFTGRYLISQIMMILSSGEKSK